MAGRTSYRDIFICKYITFLIFYIQTGSHNNEHIIWCSRLKVIRVHTFHQFVFIYTGLASYVKHILLNYYIISVTFKPRLQIY